MPEPSMSLMYLACAFGSSAICVLLAFKTAGTDPLRATYVALAVLTATLGVLKLLPATLSNSASLLVACFTAIVTFWGMRTLIRAARQRESRGT